ncbi:hypothetical protein Tco_1298802, partial [Tanacetum coccineum]
KLTSPLVAPLGDIEFSAKSSENTLSSACSSSKGNRIVRVLPPLTHLRTSTYSFYIPADIHPSFTKSPFITSDSTTQRFFHYL